MTAWSRVHEGEIASVTTRRKRESANDALFAVGLWVVAFALRFIAARWLAGEPVWDGHYYDFGARRIAEGHGYSDDRDVDGRSTWHPWCHYPVGYSAYIAAFYRVFGVHAWAAHLANALAGALVAVVVFLLAREALSKRRARLAGALTALNPGLVLYGALVMGEVVSALSVVLAFWLTLYVGRRRGALQGVAIGAIVIGVGALVRPQALLCAPFLALAVPRGETRPTSPSTGRAWATARAFVVARLPRAKASALACVLAVLPVLPWTARNCRVMDGCALVSTNGGWNLAIGSFPRATGRFETLRSSDGCRDVTGQVQQDRCWFKYGIANIEATPIRWLGLIPAKLSNTFDHESFAVEYLREARPGAWPETRRVQWRTVLTTAHRLLVVGSALAFVAWIAPWKRKPSPTRAGRDTRPDRIACAVQLFLLAAIAGSALLAFASDTSRFWPIVVGTCLLSCLNLRGGPPASAALSLPVALIATTALTHAIFFGDDRYHVVVTPVLCLLAASALRAPERAC